MPPDPVPAVENPATPQAAAVAVPVSAPPDTQSATPAASGAVDPSAQPAAGKSVSQKEKERQAFLARAERRAARDREAAGLAARQREEAEKRVKAEKERADKAEAEIARYRKDPIVAAAKDGIDVAPSISNFVSETAPEKLIKEQNERLATLEKKLEDARKEAEKVRADALAEQVQFQLHGAADRMAENTKEFPYTSAVWDQGEVRAHMRAIYDWSRSPEGRPVTIGEATAYIEKMAKVKYEKDEARRAHLRAPAQTDPASATETPPKGGQNGQTPGNRPPRTAPASSGPPTRTTSATGKRVSRVQQREEQAAADLVSLRSAIAKDRAANGVAAKK